MRMHPLLMGGASLGLPRNGLVLLADPYRDAYGLDEAGRGALQTGQDYSGRGNSLTYGASTSAGADDPSNTGTAWSFGGDDYLKGPTTAMWSNATGMTVLAVWGVPSVSNAPYVACQYSTDSKRQWVFGSSLAAFNFSVQQNPASPNSAMGAVLEVSLATKTTYFLAGRWLPSVRTQIISGNFAAQAVAVTPAASMTDCGVALEIGRYSLGALMAPNGSTCPFLAIYNRYLVDSEISRAYRYLKGLMAGRGITLA